MNKFFRPAFLAVCAALVLAGASPARAQAPRPEPPYTGYWIGSGSIWELPINTAFVKLSRRSETEFWFVVGRDGAVSGQGYVSYQAELEALKWNVPAPGVGSIEAEVSGRSEKVTYKYDITGQAQGGTELVLKVVGQQDNLSIPAFAFDFIIRARVSTPLPGPAAPAGANVSRNIQEIKVPAKGWSPFQNVAAPLRPHPAGRYTVEVRQTGAAFGIEWHAIQVVPGDANEQREELRRLRKDVEELKQKIR